MEKVGTTIITHSPPRRAMDFERGKWTLPTASSGCLNPWAWHGTCGLPPPRNSNSTDCAPSDLARPEPAKRRKQTLKQDFTESLRLFSGYWYTATSMFITYANSFTYFSYWYW